MKREISKIKIETQEYEIKDSEVRKILDILLGEEKPESDDEKSSQDKI